MCDPVTGLQPVQDVPSLHPKVARLDSGNPETPKMIQQVKRMDGRVIVISRFSFTLSNINAFYATDNGYN